MRTTTKTTTAAVLALLWGAMGCASAEVAVADVPVTQDVFTQSWIPSPGGPEAEPSAPDDDSRPNEEEGAQAGPVTVEPLPPGGTLIVARTTGVFEVAMDGRVVRQISKSPARTPRWLQGHRALVFIGQADGGDHDVRYLTVDGTTERVLGRLPLRPPCRASAYTAADPDFGETPQLGVRSDEDVWVSADGRNVCVVLSDYRHDMQSNARQVAIRLADAKRSSVLMLGGDECGVATEESLLQCESRLSTVEDLEIESPIGGYVHSRSPDHRWLLVAVGAALGDLAHVNYVLYDTRSRKLYPMPSKAGSWPSPVVLPRAPDQDTMMPGLPEVIAGDTVAWVGEHHLVLGQTLFVAGEAVVALGGDAVF